MSYDLKFSTSKFSNEDALNAKSFLLNGRSGSVSDKACMDFIYHVNGEIRRRVLGISYHRAVNDDNYVYINYRESVSDRLAIKYKSEASEKTSHESLIFVMETLKRWNESESSFATYLGSCIHSCVTEYQLSNSRLMTSVELESDSSGEHSGDEQERGRGKYLRRRMLCDFPDSDAAGSVDAGEFAVDSIPDVQDVLILEDDFCEKLKRVDGKIKSKSDLKIVVAYIILAFHIRDNMTGERIRELIGRFRKSDISSSDLDVVDFLNSYDSCCRDGKHEPGKFLAEYFGKKTSSVSRTLADAKRKGILNG